MEPLFILAVTFALLWVIFILPQQRRVRAHQALVASVQPGDEVVLSAGIYGRIVDLGPDDLTLEIASGVVIRVARQAVLRLVEDATGEPLDATETDAIALDDPEGTDDLVSDDLVSDDLGLDPDQLGTDDLDPDDLGTEHGGAARTVRDSDSPTPADGGPSGPTAPDPDNRGPAAPGPNV